MQLQGQGCVNDPRVLLVVVDLLSGNGQILDETGNTPGNAGAWGVILIVPKVAPGTYRIKVSCVDPATGGGPYTLFTYPTQHFVVTRS